MDPAWAGCQGSEAYTFTEENYLGTGFSLVKGAASLILILTMVEEPVFICEMTMDDHWPTGGGGWMYVWEFGLEPIAVATYRPLSGWYWTAGLLSPRVWKFPPFVKCRILT